MTVLVFKTLLLLLNVKHGALLDVLVSFNHNGRLQQQQISKYDWLRTGLCFIVANQCQAMKVSIF